MKRLPPCVVHQDHSEEWTRLDEEGIESLKGQIRYELGEPSLPVIVLPPGCTLDFLSEFVEDEPTPDLD